MNKVILIGRLTRDPETRYTTGDDAVCISKYTLAVDRKGKDQGADFINCVAFGKGGEFAEKYLRKGTKIAISGHIQTGSYTNKDNKKVYTTEVVAEEHEFVEKKEYESREESETQTESGVDDFVSAEDIPELPFV